MKTIWKFPLRFAHHQTLQLPFGARVMRLGLQAQDADHLFLWALLDPSPEKPAIEWDIFVVGTGHEIPDELLATCSYIGSVDPQGGLFVWHVFMREAR